ncbi:cell division protein FtsA [Hyphobacterium sp.]|uniref:cell division protein FtsA n=1 Tax=Hyphobacterium sp. TaxID=2004662 RepID=UPI003B52C5C8
MSLLRLFGSGESKPNMPSRPGVCAALDLGSSKTVCFISKAEQTAEGPRPRIIGVGHQSARGMKGGVIVDLDLARKNIQETVQRAEKMAGVAVSQVSVALTAARTRGEGVTLESAIARSEITERDMRRLQDAAIAEFQRPDEVILHAIVVSWVVDGRDEVSDPRGMYGRKLAVNMHIVTAPVGPLRNLLNCIEGCHLDLRTVVAAPYAAGLSALSDDEIELGATLIDMGAETTSAAVFANGSLARLSAAPVGGRHVTSDLARGLQTPIASAERIKILYGSALESPSDDRQMIEVPPVTGEGDRMNSAPRSMLNSIIRPRLEETFELLRDRLDISGRLDQNHRVVLTGAAAQLPGAKELAARIFGRPARLAIPHGLSGLGDAVSGPGFSVVSGIILRETRGAAEAFYGPPKLQAGRPRRRLQTSPSRPATVWRWLAESF